MHTCRAFCNQAVHFESGRTINATKIITVAVESINLRTENESNCTIIGNQTSIDSSVKLNVISNELTPCNGNTA